MTCRVSRRAALVVVCVRVRARAHGAAGLPSQGRRGAGAADAAGADGQQQGGRRRNAAGRAAGGSAGVRALVAAGVLLPLVL
jgi:hypothetical protein